MPVRFKGLSEYQRNFLWKKSYLAESYNPSVGRRYPWAGLRSDQIGNQGKSRTKIQHNAISFFLILVCCAQEKHCDKFQILTDQGHCSVK
ncbi:nuclear protein MDM1 isoform X8 [Perognathus longimembris pacificus]|uniref:nuclear protein MDM1 isoform X8 n=1 Tax=Perognathus longimembris pacificus TaxID=214514 RepID=UPI002018AF20|nr:nuclear protein MDM1 isoform X8 [Perognathus longimembris pacificus]